MRDVKQKPRMTAPKAMDRARALAQGMHKAYNRAKSKASIDKDRYDSPAEYAESELSDIAHDGIEATSRAVRKTGKKLNEKARNKLRDKLEDKLEEGTENEPDGSRRRSRGRDSPSGKSKGKESTKRRRQERANAKEPSKPKEHTRHAYSEAKPHGRSGQMSPTPKTAPKNTASTVKKAPAKTVKSASQTLKTAEKTAKVTTKAAAKTAQETAKTVEKASQAAKVTAERSAQAAKVAAEAAVKAGQAIVKALIALAKAIAAAAEKAVAAIAAGGWVAVVVIIIVAVIVLLICSAFGVFATEDTTGCKPMSEIIAEINMEYHSRMENDAYAVDLGNYEALMINYVSEGDGDAPVNNWNDVIAVFAVYCSTNTEDAMSVIELTDISIDYIRRIFYEMNSYYLTTSGSYDEEEEMWVLTVYVNQYSMNYREAADHFNFTDYQREILYEMMKPEYCSYFARLMGIDVSGNTNVSDILAMLPSDKGADVVSAALTKLGAPYVLGAKGDDKFDCSGLVCWAINQVDPALGDHFWCCAADQAHYCENMTIEQSALQPGDLVFWQKKYCSGCGRWNEIHHVGIYIGMGKVIEASSSKGRVVIRDLWSTDSYPLFMFARPYS